MFYAIFVFTLIIDHKLILLTHFFNLLGVHVMDLVLNEITIVITYIASQDHQNWRSRGNERL